MNELIQMVFKMTMVLLIITFVVYSIATILNQMSYYFLYKKLIEDYFSRYPNGVSKKDIHKYLLKEGFFYERGRFSKYYVDRILNKMIKNKELFTVPLTSGVIYYRKQQ